ISPALGKSLIKFHRMNKTLCEHLSEDETVSIFEKINFYQSHELRNTKYMETTQNGANVVDLLKNVKNNNNIDFVLEFFLCDDALLPLPPLPPPPLDCKCSQLIVVPEHLPTGGNTQKEHYHWTQKYKEIGPQAIKTPLSSGGETWQYHRALGAAKWHALYTDGWKEQKGILDSVIVTEGLGSSGTNTTHQGIIRFHLFCTNELEFSEDCECEKDITFNYNYEVKAYTKSYTNSSTGDKKSYASAQDLALAYCYETDDKGTDVNNIQIIRGSDVRAAAQCAISVNPAYNENWRSLGHSIISLITDETGAVYEWGNYVYSYDTTQISIDTLVIPPDTMYSFSYTIDSTVVDSSIVVIVNPNASGYIGLFDNIFNILTTPQFSPANCTQKTTSGGFKGNFRTKLYPNKQLTFGLLSNYVLKSAGMRSWYSEAAVSSDYGLSVVSTPGLTSGEEFDCCTPYAGAYLVGAGSLASSIDFGSRVRNDLYITGGFPTSWPNGLNANGGVHGNVGLITVNPEHASCPVPVNPRSIRISDSNIMPQSGRISIYTIDGKLLYIYNFMSSTENVTEQVLKNNITNKNYGLTSGIYIISYTDGNSIHSFKYITND
ncbi:MAG: T9SS type A sorting domain-containing protein, partial [Saprospiraceae bacterium]